MPPERVFGRWMAFSALLYGLGALAFAVAPNLAHSLPDAAYRMLPPFADWEPLPDALALNWHGLAVSMMITITVCSVFAARDPVRNKDFAVPVMFSKGTSSVLGLAALALHAKYAFYVCIVLTDFPLLVITWLLWRRIPRPQDG
jgi:hypothetical protein